MDLLLKLLGFILIIVINIYIHIKGTDLLVKINFNNDWFNLLSEISTIIASLGSVLLLLVTFLYFIETRKMVHQTKRQTELMEEPAVTLKIIPDNKNTSALNILLKNTGGGPAYDISVSFNPDLPYKDTTLNELRMFKGMPLLDKGETVEFFFASAHTYLNGDDTKQTTAEIKYYKTPVYERNINYPIIRKIEIDIEERIGQLHLETKNIHHLVNEIEELKHAIILSQYAGKGDGKSDK